jgi:hypothetical protein
MSEGGDGDAIGRQAEGLLYRRAYGLARDRLDAALFGSVSTRARLDLLRGRTLAEVLGALGLGEGSDGSGVVREAVEDAASGRPPRW